MEGTPTFTACGVAVALFFTPVIGGIEKIRIKKVKKRRICTPLACLECGTTLRLIISYCPAFVKEMFK